MDETIKKYIHSKLALLPRKPGCYLMKDNTGKVIYVGKAKILKNRVSSYFRGEKTGKTKALVSNIVDFEYIVTESEKEAFLLEINLIKKYDPKYNIIFRDDKSYPYIALTVSPYPKLDIVRPRVGNTDAGEAVFVRKGGVEMVCVPIIEDPFCASLGYIKKTAEAAG